MWREKLEKNEIDEEKYKWSLNPPATVEQIIKFAKTVKDEFNYDLPEGYLEFLRVTDGLSSCGYEINGTIEELIIKSEISKYYLGLIRLNNDLYNLFPEMKKYIFFGEVELDWYVFDREDGLYKVLDKFSDEAWEKYNTFEELLDYILSEICNYLEI